MSDLEAAPKKLFGFIPRKAKVKPANGLMSPLACLFSFFCTCSSTAPLSVPNPASMSGPVSCIFIIALLGILYGWPCILVAKHMKEGEVTLLDEIMNEKYPKWRFVVSFFAKLSSFLIMIGACIALFMFVYTSMMNLIFNQWESTRDKNYLVFLPAVGVFCMSLINDPKIFVTLTSFGAFGTLITFLSLIVYCVKKCTHENAILYKDQWAHPSRYEPWISGSKKGVGQSCMLAGVLSMSYFVHNCVSTILCVNAKPETNQKVTAAAFVLLFIMYWLVAAVGAVPFANALLPNISLKERIDAYAPGIFLNAFYVSDSTENVKYWYYVVATFIYGLQCFFTLPLLYRVTRVSSVDIINWEKRFGKKVAFIARAIMNVIIVLISAFATAYNVSLQLVMQIFGFLATIVWVCGLPIIYDVLMTRGDKNWLPRSIFSITSSVLLILILILQYCLPVMPTTA